MLSRLLGRRAPLAPARLLALTAEPGRTLARSVTVIHQELGALALPDGRVVVCDPHDPGGPLARRLAAGRYRVQLRVADLGGRDQRAAAVILMAGDRPPVRWESADDEGGAEHKLSVDSATGCLAGPAALAALYAPGGADAVDELVEALAQTERATWCWANHELAADGNLVAFSAGYGDGVYPVFWGLRADGEPVCLLVDLRVLDARHDADA